MITYHDYAPTGFDPSGHALSDRQRWLVFPIGRNRDTDDPIEVSNWRTTVAALEGISPEGKGWEIHRFGHWACGWFEIILISPRAKKVLACAEELCSSLADCPILDESDFNLAEDESQREAWDCYARRDFTKALAKAFCNEGNELAADWIEDMPSEDIDSLASKAMQRTSKYPESSGFGDWRYPIAAWVDCLGVEDLPETPPMPVFHGCGYHAKPTFGCPTCRENRDAFKPYMGEVL